jgi:hypothetical protein
MKFSLHPYDRYDKELVITGPAEMKIAIDFDDVDHDQVEREVGVLLRILNENWKTAA